MIQQYLQIVFISVFCLITAFLTLLVIASAWVDYKSAVVKSLAAKLPKNTKHRCISVIVYAQDNAITVTESLKSVLSSKYRSLSLVVIDNASKDLTSTIIRDFLKQHSVANVRLITKRKRTSKSQALLQAYKNTTHGSLIVVMNGDTVLEPYALTDLNKNIIITESPCYRIATQSTFIQSYESFIKTLIRLSYEKFLSTKFYFMPGKGTELKTFACHREQFKLNISTANIDEKRNAKISSAGCWLLFVITSVYALYVSIVFQQSDLLLYSFLLVLVWFCFVIMSSESLKLKQKLSLAFVLPVSYLLLITVPITLFLKSAVKNNILSTD